MREPLVLSGLENTGCNDSTLHVLPGGPYYPDLVTIQVSTRFYDPEEGRKISETAYIKLDFDQQDQLIQALTAYRAEQDMTP